jgi:hypothetical protein
MHEQTQTEQYEKPQIADYGDIQELTLATGGKNKLDATFPVGTPFGDLTFS